MTKSHDIDQFTQKMVRSDGAKQLHRGPMFEVQVFFQPHLKKGLDIIMNLIYPKGITSFWKKWMELTQRFSSWYFLRLTMRIYSNNKLCLFQYLLHCILYIIKGSLEVLTSDYTESCRSLLQHRCLTAEMFWRVGIARNAVFFHSFVASKARKGRSEKRELRRIGCPRCRQNSHHACARKRFGSQNR